MYVLNVVLVLQTLYYLFAVVAVKCVGSKNEAAKIGQESVAVGWFVL